MYVKKKTGHKRGDKRMGNMIEKGERNASILFHRLEIDLASSTKL